MGRGVKRNVLALNSYYDNAQQSTRTLLVAGTMISATAWGLELKADIRFIRTRQYTRLSVSLCEYSIYFVSLLNVSDKIVFVEYHRPTITHSTCNGSTLRIHYGSC